MMMELNHITAIVTNPVAPRNMILIAYTEFVSAPVKPAMRCFLGIDKNFLSRKYFHSRYARNVLMRAPRVSARYTIMLSKVSVENSVEIPGGQCKPQTSTSAQKR